MSMPEQPPGDPKFQSQRDALLTAFARNGIKLAVGLDEQGAPLSVHQEDHLLVQTDDLPRARTVVPNVREAPGETQTQASRITRVAINEPGKSVPARALREMRDELNQTAGRRVASLNNIVSIAPVGTCPANEPAPAQMPPNPAVNPDGTAGAGVKVLVIDTGLVPEFKDHSWLAAEDVTGRSRLPGAPPVDGQTRTTTDPEDPVHPDEIKEYAGHGTFIAGVLRCVAPAVQVFVSNAMQSVLAGAILENDFHDFLVTVLDEQGWPDIISLSAGACTEGNKPLLGLDHFVQGLREHPDTVLVAAAGNHGNRTPFWPAALAGPAPTAEPGVVSVGALRQDGMGLACFSNFGPWVSAYAPGERLVNAFIKNPSKYTYRDPAADHCRYYPAPALYDGCTCVTAPRKDSTTDFFGMAEWSGTSFSTPIVAGMIAARLSIMRKRGKTSSREAAAALLAEAGSVDGAGPALLPTGWTPGYGWAAGR
jgi:subtilisin family serine protease